MLSYLRSIVGGTSIVLASAGIISAQQPTGRATGIATRRAVVPQVTGITLDSARLVLGAFKLTPVIDPNTPGRSIVTTQNPAAGQPIPTDRNVQLAVGPGRNTVVSGAAGILSRPDRLTPRTPKVVVPAVVGMSGLAAARLIVAAGLQPAARDTQLARPIPGIVVRQNPIAGDSVPPRAIITIVVAQAPPRPKVMPNVVGFTRQLAQRTLAAETVFVRGVDSRVSEDSVGVVVGQNPGPGQSITAGTQATLTIGTHSQVKDTAVTDSARVSRDSTSVPATDTTSLPQLPIIPDSVTVPDVRGRTLAQALDVLRTSRLRANYPSNAARTDTVAQEKPVNIRVPVDSIVVLDVKRRAAATTTSGTVDKPAAPVGDLNLNPPIVVQSANPERFRLPGWAIVLISIGVIGLSSVLWKVLQRTPPAEKPSVEESSSVDPGEPGGTPAFGTHLGRGIMDDSVQSSPQPLIARSIELVPRLATVASEIVGPFPTIRPIQKER